jgi:hypothetical protein
VWVYAYRAGQPASGVEAKLGARVLGVTSAQGVVGGAVTTGPQTLMVRDGEREVAIDLDLAAGEQVQIALQFVPGRAPAYTLKSSVKGTTTVDLAAREAAAAAAAQAAPVTAGADAAAPADAAGAAPGAAPAPGTGKEPAPGAPGGRCCICCICCICC